MKDALDRRSRFAKPQPEDKRIILTERDLVLFETIDRHGKLPTNFLYEFTKHVAKNYGEIQRRLTLLYNGFCDHPEHGRNEHACRPQTYVTRDWQQFNNIQARYQPAVYGLTRLAKLELAERGRGFAFSPERNDPFVHQFMGACFSASVELRAREAGIRFIPTDEILRHEKCPEATRTAENPLAIPVADSQIGHIVPDNLFGLEYPDGGFRFFAVEIDRNTETISPKKPVKNSIAKKVRGYVNILENRTAAQHLGLPNLTVLFVTTNVAHMHAMVAHVKENAGRHHAKFLFSAYPTFGEVWRVPREILPVFDPYFTTTGNVDISKKA